MLKSVQKNRVSRVTCGCKPPEAAHVPSMPEVEALCQLEHYRTKQDNWSFCYLAAGSRDSVKSRGQAASQPCFEKPDVSHSSLTLVYIPLIPTEERELPERILREKPQSKIRLIHLQSLHKSLFKFLNSLPLHCQILERHFTKTLFSPFPLL